MLQRHRNQYQQGDHEMRACIAKAICEQQHADQVLQYQESGGNEGPLANPWNIASSRRDGSQDRHHDERDNDQTAQDLVNTSQSCSPLSPRYARRATRAARIIAASSPAAPPAAIAVGFGSGPGRTTRPSP